MAPPNLEIFPSSQLPQRSQITVQGRRRKEFDGDLTTCELLEMVQYKCVVDEPITKQSPTRCWPVVRLFRRCQDREKGKEQKRSFLVETTAWEGEKAS